MNQKKSHHELVLTVRKRSGGRGSPELWDVTVFGRSRNRKPKEQSQGSLDIS